MSIISLRILRIILNNLKCFAPYEYKKRLIITLLDRTFMINSLCHSLMRNMYPTRFIDRVVRQFLDKKLSKTVNEKIPEMVS